ncbi:MAG: hypothetical protein ACK56I_31030, partial [bacterium]
RDQRPGIRIDRGSAETEKWEHSGRPELRRESRGQQRAIGIAIPAVAAGHPRGRIAPAAVHRIGHERPGEEGRAAAHGHGERDGVVTAPRRRAIPRRAPPAPAHHRLGETCAQIDGEPAQDQVAAIGDRDRDAETLQQ